MKLEPGQRFPDLDLPDHTDRPRRLSEIAGGDPLSAFRAGLGARFTFPSDPDGVWLEKVAAGCFHMKNCP
ncbi:MAG: hypothetical protein H0W96_05525 [Solirubrobacterales bacterium]|nr:hypothetical protein [Solirubrobacterales bacterium]